MQATRVLVSSGLLALQLTGCAAHHGPPAGAAAHPHPAPTDGILAWEPIRIGTRVNLSFRGGEHRSAWVAGGDDSVLVVSDGADWWSRQRAADLDTFPRRQIAALERARNGGGTRLAIAVVAGALLGALVTVSALPEHWEWGD